MRDKKASANPEDRFFAASEIAHICQVDLKTIHNWTDRGAIRSFSTPGGHRRYRAGDVKAFLEKHGYPIPAELRDVAASEESKPASTDLGPDRKVAIARWRSLSEDDRERVRGVLVASLPPAIHGPTIACLDALCER